MKTNDGCIFYATEIGHFLQRSIASPNGILSNFLRRGIFIDFFMFSSNFTQFVETTILEYWAALWNISRVVNSIVILWQKQILRHCFMLIYLESECIMILTEIGNETTIGHRLTLQKQ